MTVREVPFEQAVYGSFPFWDRGYAVLAQSPGCRPEWLSALREACQRLGERPAGAAEAGGLFAMPIRDGTWMVVGVAPQGLDDRGRPGAVAFHALFLTPRAYRRAGSSPFGLARALRADWTAETRELPAGACAVEIPGPAETSGDDRAARIASCLAEGRRVAILAPGPIDALAGPVWAALPERVRRRASVATWAFGNANRFDLVALPRLAGVELDPSYVTIDLDGPEGWAAPDPQGLRRSGGSGRMRLAPPLIGAAMVAVGIGLGLSWHRGERATSSIPARSGGSNARPIGPTIGGIGIGMGPTPTSDGG